MRSIAVDVRPARRRRWLAAGAGAGMALVVACWTASAAGLPNSAGTAGMPASSPSPSPSPSPSSSDCPVPVPVGPTAVPTAMPTACATSPTPSPSAHATPSPASTSRSTTVRGPGASASPGAASGASATPPSAAAIAAVQQPAFLRLLGLLGTPTSVGVENPTLEHFGRLPSDGVVLTGDGRPARPSPPPAAPPHPGGTPVPLLVLVLIVLGLGASVATSLRVRRAGRAAIARASRIAVVPLLLAGGSLAAVSLTSTSAVIHAPAAHVARPTTPRVVAPAAAPVTTVSSPVLAQLVTLESQMSSDEGRIRALSAAIEPASPVVTVAQPAAAVPPTPATTAATPAAAPNTPRGPFDEGTDPLGTAHQLALSLEATQQAEYNLFLAIAQDPSQTAALVAAAANAPAEVRQAVAYNVQAVQAQLAQEAAIAQAARNNVNQSAAPKTLLAPLEGPITQPFGPSTLVVEPPLSFNGVTYPHFHTGVDIAGPLDAPVRAAADGVVALAGAETDGQGHLVGYGNYIVIAHAGKMITLYGHLDQLLVKPGQPVHAGDVIGLEGSSGNSTGPHLHFEVRVAGLLADPAPYLGKQLVR